MRSPNNALPKKKKKTWEKGDDDVRGIGIKEKAKGECVCVCEGG